MTLKNDQVATLMKFVASVTPDGLCCDDCAEHVPELAEAQLGKVPLSEFLEQVQNHLQNCPCCAKEYQTFLDALNTIDEPQ